MITGVAIPTWAVCAAWRSAVAFVDRIRIELLIYKRCDPGCLNFLKVRPNARRTSDGEHNARCADRQSSSTASSSIAVQPLSELAIT